MRCLPYVSLAFRSTRYNGWFRNNLLNWSNMLSEYTYGNMTKYIALVSSWQKPDIDTEIIISTYNVAKSSNISIRL